MSISGIKASFHAAGTRIKESYRKVDKSEVAKSIGKVCLKALACLVVGLAYITGFILIEVFPIPAIIALAAVTVGIGIVAGCVKVHEVYQKRKAARAL